MFGFRSLANDFVVWTSLADTNSMLIRPWPDEKDNDRGLYQCNGSVVALDATEWPYAVGSTRNLQLFITTVHSLATHRSLPFIECSSFPRKAAWLAWP